MTRQGTVIRHTLLDSDTYAAMPDNVRSVFLCLLLASDDWGRLPDNPLKLGRMIAVCCKLPGEVKDCVDWMLTDGCLERYRIGEDSYLHWVKWEVYQERLKSRDKAIYPSPDGELEVSTNPLIRSRQSPDGIPHGTPPDIPDGSPPGPTKERKGKEIKIRKGKERKEKISRAELNPEYTALVTELFPPAEYQNWTEAHRLSHIEALDKLIRIDGFPVQEVFTVLRWMRSDEFWNANFQSIVALRKNGAGKYLSARGQLKKAGPSLFGKDKIVVTLADGRKEETTRG